jgi:hypothetical protein
MVPSTGVESKWSPEIGSLRKLEFFRNGGLHSGEIARADEDGGGDGRGSISIDVDAWLPYFHGIVARPRLKLFIGGNSFGHPIT